MGIRVGRLSDDSRGSQSRHSRSSKKSTRVIQKNDFAPEDADRRRQQLIAGGIIAAMVVVFGGLWFSGWFDDGSNRLAADGTTGSGIMADGRHVSVAANAPQVLGHGGNQMNIDKVQQGYMSTIDSNSQNSTPEQTALMKARLEGMMKRAQGGR
jgi:hypothetical protein